MIFSWPVAGRLQKACKGRGVCPSCNGRRMAQTAAHLVDHVIPPVAVRQWVISVPKRLRSPLAAALTLGGCAHPWRLRWFLAQRDRPEAVAALTNIFMREVERLVREAAGVASSPAAGDAPRIGAVSFLHRERLGTRAACPSACVRDGRRVLPDRDG